MFEAITSLFLQQKDLIALLNGCWAIVRLLTQIWIAVLIHTLSAIYTSEQAKTGLLCIRNHFHPN